MSEKDWQSADLVFDLDADHLPSVTLGEDTYAEMLAKCKDALFRLLEFLEDDFASEDLERSSFRAAAAITFTSGTKTSCT